MTEETERIIKGELESWATEVRDFNKNNRGSRGLKVENEWHNIVGNIIELEQLDQKFPKGTMVRFKEVKNKRGYWDINGVIIPIEKKEAYTEDVEAKPIKNIPDERQSEIKLQCCMKGAVEIIKLVYGGVEELPVKEVILEGVELLTIGLYKSLKASKEKLKKEEQW